MALPYDNRQTVSGPGVHRRIERNTMVAKILELPRACGKKFTIVGSHCAIPQPVDIKSDSEPCDRHFILHGETCCHLVDAHILFQREDVGT